MDSNIDLDTGIVKFDEDEYMFSGTGKKKKPKGQSKTDSAMFITFFFIIVTIFAYYLTFYIL